MSTGPLRSVAPERDLRRAVIEARRLRPIGSILVDLNLLKAADLKKALALQSREDAPLGDILLTHDMLTEEQFFAGLQHKYGVKVIDLDETPPDLDLVDEFGVERCIQDGVVPWQKIGGATVMVTSRPHEFEELRTTLPDGFGPVVMALASEKHIHEAIMAERHHALVHRAENRTFDYESSRNWDTGKLKRTVIVLCLIIAGGLYYSYPTVFSIFLIWAIITLVLNTCLKISALFALLKSQKPVDVVEPPVDAKLPMFSIMVPLYEEKDVAPRLIARLDRLDYPKELLDICLVLEEDDLKTQEALKNVNLPRWMRPIKVAKGTLKTKPRALNFALDFCRGSILGVYDAEDAPEPDQLRKIAQRFNERGPNVACLQGVLDYYNMRTNWLSRCFTIEYASWFRVVLPGLQRLGLAIPLGGTTLFFRREALEELGGWDAHNVTEDADLGIRLARHGFTTELVDTVTYEEANCRAWPWIKQRSRWLKGYAITYAVHMRSPRRLLRDLGFRKFFGVQMLFLGTLSQFALAPILWSFWLALFGLPHPLVGIAPAWMFITLGSLFLLSEVSTIAIGMFAVSTTKHRRLMAWVPTLHFYFPLGALASYKGLAELLTRPFYWDKTAHGVFEPTEEDRD